MGTVNRVHRFLYRVASHPVTPPLGIPVMFLVVALLVTHVTSFTLTVWLLGAMMAFSTVMLVTICFPPRRPKP